MSEQTVKYPNIEVELVGQDGNPLAIVGRVSKALRANGVEQNKVKEFQDEALSGDYNHVLQTCLKWVECS